MVQGHLVSTSRPSGRTVVGLVRLKGSQAFCDSEIDGASAVGAGY